MTGHLSTLYFIRNETKLRSFPPHMRSDSHMTPTVIARGNIAFILILLPYFSNIAFFANIRNNTRRPELKISLNLNSEAALDFTVGIHLLLEIKIYRK